MNKPFSWPKLKKEKVPPEQPLLRDDEAEIRERLEKEKFQRGTIALDVTIDKNDVPYILEIQGKDAGIFGIVEELEEHEVRPHLKKVAQLWSDDKNERYQNPTWFDAITRDKRLQGEFIPDANRPDTVIDGDFDRLFERGRVILKPYNGMQGQGIKIFDRTTIDAAHEYADELKQRGGYVAQVFIEARGADNAPEDLKSHQTSLRLVIPFKLDNKGEPEIMIPRLGYQRVSRYGLAEIGERIRGRRVVAEDAGVVNLARDAAAVPMSDEEYELVKPVAIEIIKRVVQHIPEEKHREHIVERALEKRFFDNFVKMRTAYSGISFNIYKNLVLSITILILQLLYASSVY